MNVMKEIVTPVFTMVVFVALLWWILFMIRKGFRKMFPNPDLWWKYKWRGKWDEGKVKFCYEAIGKNMTSADVHKIMLIKGNTKGQIREILYLYDIIFKKVKGGNKQ